jgi:hypothetical protein
VGTRRIDDEQGNSTSSRPDFYRRLKRSNGLASSSATTAAISNDADDEIDIDIANVLDGSGARARSIRATIAHANVKNVSGDRNRLQIEPQRFSSRNDSPQAFARSVAKKMCVLQENDQSTRSV